MQRWAGIARMGGLGDNLVAASVLRPLKRLGYMTEVITSELAHVVFHNNPHVDKLSVKRDDDIPKGPDWQKWFVARSREFDLFAHLSHSMEVRHALHTDSTAFNWRPEFRRKICAGSYLETVHDIVGVPHDFGPLFFPTGEEREKVSAVTRDKVGDRYAVWVISGSRVDKVYQYAPIAIARVIKELDIPVIIAGVGGKQNEMATAIKDAVSVHNSTRDKIHICVSHEGQTLDQQMPMRFPLTMAMQASLVVTPDTGTAWAVAMEDMPKVVMVSHASAENITKHWVNTTTLHADPARVPCWPCHRLHDSIDTCVPDKDVGKGAACMGDISVETVVRAVDSAWNNRRIDTSKVVKIHARH
jgi:ADP-heptose:LPS heptosyltransferase